MKIKKFGFCKWYNNYYSNISGKDVDIQQFIILVLLPGLFCSIVTWVICSAFLHLPRVDVIISATLTAGISTVLGFMTAIIFSTIAGETKNSHSEYERFIFPACLTNWLSLSIIDLISLPFIAVINLFHKERYVTLDQLLTGYFKKSNIEPYIIRTPQAVRPKSPFSVDLLLDNAAEIVRDQIGRPLVDDKEKVKVEKTVIKGDTAYVYFSVSRIERIDQRDIVQVGYFFVTLTIDTDLGFIGVKNLFFDSSYGQKSSQDRLHNFEQYMDKVSDTLGLGFRPVDDKLLREMHELAHRGGESSSPSARSVAE